MSIHQHATIEDTLYFFFGANDTSGSGADGATPVYDVRLAGAAAGAIPTLSGAATLLTHANYPAGAHEIAIAATDGNGFAANATYAVFCTLLVDSQNPTGFVGSFTLGPIVANTIQISDDATAADNLEAGYDGTGLIGDTFPLRQDQGASISGGLAVRSNMTSVTVIQGSQQDLSNTNASNNTRWTGDDDGAGAEFIFLCTPADTTAEPGDLHFEGYYDEPGAPKTNGATISVYNFQLAAWESHITLTDASADETHDVSLTHANGAPGSGTLETVAYTIGDVLIKVEQDTQETGNACLLIDRMYVGFISAPVTATEIVDEWETQSQADPTGFHVNIQEWIGVVPLALSSQQVQVDLTFIHGTALTEGTSGYLAAAFVKLFDVATPVLVASDVMVGTDGANTTVPDAATTAAGLHATTEALVSAASIRTAVGLASANLDTQLGAIPTTMVGTDNAALASVCTEARLAELDAAKMPADVDAIKVITDALTAAAAAKLATSAGTIVTGAAEAGTLSTTQMTSDLSETTNDHYNGRIIIWTSGVLQSQATNITDYVGSGGLLTFTAVTEAPSAADTFIII